MPGRRVAFVAGPPPLIDALTKASEWSMLHGAYVNQAAATAVLRGPRDWIAGIAAEFQQARDLLCARIAQFGAITAVTPGGGPFVFLNVSRLRAGAADVAQILLEEFGIPTTSGDFLHGPQHLRLAFGAGLDVLSEVADRLARAVELIGVRANGGSEIQCRNARGPE